MTYLPTCGWILWVNIRKYTIHRCYGNDSFPQFSKGHAMMSLPGFIWYSFPGSSLEIMWFNPLPGSKIGSCSRHQSPGLSPQASQGAVLWMAHPIFRMDGRYETWRFTCLPYKPCDFARCCMIFRFVPCVLELCFQSSTEYSGGIENRWCLWNKKGSSHVG